MCLNSTDFRPLFQGVVDTKYEFFIYSGALAITAQIVRNEGPLGLYRGFVSTCTREVGGYFFFFGGYQLSKRLLTPAGKTVDDLGKIIFLLMLIQSQFKVATRVEVKTT